MKYEKPIWEIIELEIEDIVCTSSDLNIGTDDDGWIN